MARALPYEQYMYIIYKKPNNCPGKIFDLLHSMALIFIRFPAYNKQKNILQNYRTTLKLVGYKNGQISFLPGFSFNSP